MFITPCTWWGPAPADHGNTCLCGGDTAGCFQTVPSSSAFWMLFGNKGAESLSIPAANSQLEGTASLLHSGWVVLVIHLCDHSIWAAEAERRPRTSSVGKKTSWAKKCARTLPCWEHAADKGLPWGFWPFEWQERKINVTCIFFFFFFFSFCSRTTTAASPLPRCPRQRASEGAIEKETGKCSQHQYHSSYNGRRRNKLRRKFFLW